MVGWTARTTARSSRGGPRRGRAGGSNISRWVTVVSILPSARSGGWGTGSVCHEGGVERALSVRRAGPVDDGAEAERGRGHLELGDPRRAEGAQEADQG